MMTVSETQTAEAVLVDSLNSWTTDQFCEVGWGSLAAREAIEHLRAAGYILTAALSDQWHDISTAPKDGRTALIAGRYKNGVAFVETSYWDSRGYWAARKLDPPTHWQPLPQAPK